MYYAVNLLAFLCLRQTLLVSYTDRALPPLCVGDLLEGGWPALFTESEWEGGWLSYLMEADRKQPPPPPPTPAHY